MVFLDVPGSTFLLNLQADDYPKEALRSVPLLLSVSLLIWMTLIPSLCSFFESMPLLRSSYVLRSKPYLRSGLLLRSSSDLLSGMWFV